MTQDRNRGVLRAAGLALLLALLIAGLLKSRGTGTSATEAPPAVARVASTRIESPPVGREEVAAETKPEEPEFEPPLDDGPLGAREGCVGFIYRDGSCFALDSSEMPEPGVRDRFPLHSAPIASDPRLEALSTSKSRSFEPFLDLKEDVKTVPHFWMDLSTERVRTEEEDVRQPDKLTAINRTEVLTDEWLLAWREMFRATEAILVLVKEAPHPEKRGALLEAAGRLRDGWTRARTERNGEGEWKRSAERECLVPGATVLGSLGLRDGGPGWPNRDELTSTIMGSSGASEFVRTVTETWGGGAVDALVFRERVGGDRSWAPVSDIAALSETEFSELKEDAVAGFKVKPLTPVPESLDACGVTFMDLEESDRTRLLLVSGAKVVAVQPGSAGARAGLMVGDLVYGTQVRELESEEFREGRRIGEALDLSYLIGWEEKPAEFRLLIFRGDREMSVDIPRK